MASNSGQKGAVVEQEGNLMTSQACSGPCFYSLVNKWLLPNTKSDSGSEAPIIPGCVYGLNTEKPLKSSLQFSLTWSPNSWDNSFHLEWNALSPFFSTISQNPRFSDRDMENRSSNSFPQHTMNPGRRIKTGPLLNSSPKNQQHCWEGRAIVTSLSFAFWKQNNNWRSSVPTQLD